MVGLNENVLIIFLRQVVIKNGIVLSKVVVRCEEYHYRCQRELCGQDAIYLADEAHSSTWVILQGKVLGRERVPLIVAPHSLRHFFNLF